MNKQMLEAELRLFKGYTLNDTEDLKSNEQLFEEGLKYGVLLPNIPQISEAQDIFDIAVNMYGKDGEKWNQTFHKSFATVRDTDYMTLVMQQLIHYFTTYGLESLGYMNNDLVYIPHESLEIPELNEDVPLVVIKELSAKELGEKLMTLLSSGIALSEETLQDINVLSDYIPKDRFDEITNREFKIAMYDKYNVVPSNNLEFLRYLIFKTTKATLLINNDITFKAIKNCDKTVALNLLNNYVSKPNGYINLAKLGYRFKELFLAFKDSSETKEAKNINKIINKIIKLSKTYHTPLKGNIVDNLTKIKTVEEVDAVTPSLIKALDNITTFREIRILNALEYRLTGNKNIVYKIRNGKAFVNVSNAVLNSETIRAFNKLVTIIKNHLVDRIKKNVENKSIFIPAGVNYTAPTSEKQFINNIPEGSYIEVPRTNDLIVGVHWTNLSKTDDYYDNGRVDLDMHATNRGEQYGWNSSYRNDTSDFYFSGDVTDAQLPNGATELFYIGRNCGTKSFLLTLNDYTSKKCGIPFEFVIAKADKSNIEKNYVIDPNDILVKLDMNIPKGINQINLGLVVIGETLRFYLNDFTLGSSIVTRRSDVTMGAKDYLDNYSKIQVTLNELLQRAGANITSTPTVSVKEYLEILETTSDGKQTVESITKDRADELIKQGNGHLVLSREVESKPDIDLSLESITKDSIIKLFM